MADDIFARLQQMGFGQGGGQPQNVGSVLGSVLGVNFGKGTNGLVSDSAGVVPLDRNILSVNSKTKHSFDDLLKGMHKDISEAAGRIQGAGGGPPMDANSQNHFALETATTGRNEAMPVKGGREGPP